MSSLEDHLNWLNLHNEETIDPERPIIDPHHHFWPGDLHYLLDDLRLDTESGHNIKKTVFIECSQEYLEEGDQDFAPVGETIFVKKICDAAKEESQRTQIEGIVGHVNLLIGAEKTKAVLKSHLKEGGALFKGIRHAGGWDHHYELSNSHHNPPKNLYSDETFLESLNELSNMNLSFEAWQYHHQVNQVKKIAETLPNLKIVLNHFSGPIGIGPYATKKDEIFEVWKTDILTLSKYENVYAKLGGMAMPINGYEFHKQASPATSDQLIKEQEHSYHFLIKSFGAERCMFESNFPVDKQSISYNVLWNAFKKMADRYNSEEKDQMFYKTAQSFYKL